MKNPLFTRFVGLRINQRLKSAMHMLLLVVVVYNIGLAQSNPVIDKTECTCLNNATTPTNGQYMDYITINSGITGQDWRLVGPITGFYNPASLNPPVDPILYLPNTPIPEVSPGVYRIFGKRVSGQQWSARVKNMINGYEQEIHSIQPCSYPNVVTLTGDVNACRSSNEVYALPPALYQATSWNVTGGQISTNPVLPASGNTSITVGWGTTPGRNAVKVQGIVTSYAAQPVGCNFAAEKIVDIIDPAPFTKIVGDAGNCVGSTKTYTLTPPINQLNNLVWGYFLNEACTIPATGLSVSGSGKSRTIIWPNTPGTFYIRVTGGFRINITSDYCSFTTILPVSVVSEATVPLACNNLVNVSMNPSCELFFTPDQFLEDQVYPDNSYNIIIKDQSTGQIIPTGTLGYNYIGKTLLVQIVHECSGNSCWGYAYIEDKAIPDLVCPGDSIVNCDEVNDVSKTGFPRLPLGAVATPVPSKSNTWSVTGYDLCSTVTMYYTDQLEAGICDGPFSSIITRTWYVTDNSSNSSSCTQQISVNRAFIEDVIFPGSWDDAAGPNPSLEACGDWPVLPQDHQFAGNPHPDYTGYPVGTLCLKAAVTFSDRKVLLCNNNGSTYKVVRKWQVIDHCTGQIREENQLITVMDTEGPVVSCPADLTADYGEGVVNLAAIVPVKSHLCVGDWKVIPPTVIYDCNSTTWDVNFLLADVDGNPPAEGGYVKKVGLTEVTGSNGNFTIINLPKGRTWIRYTVTDACGNFTYCFTEVDVVDNQPPVAVCDKNSIIAIGKDSKAYAGVLTFDDGSHDNCQLSCMKIRRMDQLVDWSTLSCNNQLLFTCADLGPNKTIMVEMGVWDNLGLFNSCMVEAKMQDNIFPVITAPSPTTANCYEDLTSLTRFGTATATDNCSVTLTETRNDQLNECGLGTITRTFIATDIAGNVTTATQVITVGNNRKFNGATDIRWPSTVNVNVGCVADITPEKLNSRPTYLRNTECALLASSYEDIIFNYTDNVCVKVLRKWTVIDWCQKNPFIPGSGEWSATQLIMLNNTVAPNITKGCLPADLKITQEGQCQARVEVTAAATDDCTPTNLLEWTYTIDLNNDNVIDVTNGTGNTINQIFSYGTHKITWTVRDGCRNVKTCSNTFTVRDDKKPSPYCISDIVTVIMPVAKEVNVWASDFNRGTTDNCSAASDITASFSSTNRNEISRTVKCADLAGAPSKEFTYNIYFIDAAGNSDFCTVTVKVQDNNNSCGTTTVVQKLAIKGNIFTEADEVLESVDVELQSNQTEFPKSLTTGKDGSYAFADLPMYKNYSLFADKNDDILNGISTLDLVMMQRHILGLTELPTPYKLIAADVNNSSKITAADMVELRKVILGIQPGFSNNRSWRFVDVAHRFADPKNPFPFTESMAMDNLDHDVAGMDFIAVKIGDVNGSATPNSATGQNVLSRSRFALLSTPVTGKAGDVVKVGIRKQESVAILGLQMTLAVNPSLAEIQDVTSVLAGFDQQHLGFSDLSSGKVHVSWNGASASENQDELFILTLKLKKDATQQDVVSLDESGLDAEVYTIDQQSVQSLAATLLSTRDDKQQNVQFELYQNIPNPFSTSTTIGFHLPAAGNATLNIFDLSGKLLFSQTGTFQKGVNAFNIDASQVHMNGVLYYQVATETDSATRKLIILK